VPTDTDIAWAAGLFEGEGCIGIWWPPSTIGRRRNPQIRLQVTMTDRDTVQEFCRIVECGGVSQEQNRKPPRKNCWYWTIGNPTDVERILRAFYPRLGERRRAKADEAFAEIDRRNADLRRVCVGCGVKFVASTRGPTAKFCSEPCRMRTYHAKHKGVPVSMRVLA
jgi:hypothetical protein